MMRSLFAGVAGLKTHQTRMDVIGNNIANVNTTSYKSQSMTFSDLMYQTTQPASGASGLRGGINARQIGLGSKTSAIKTSITSQGASQTTNDPFDVRISGDAFFVVSDGGDKFFTRDGSFYIDGRGNLAMTSTGFIVQGWQEKDPETGNILKKEVQPLRIMTNENQTFPPEATTYATIGGLCDKNDTDINSADGKQMNLEFFDNQGYSYTAQFSVHAVKDQNGDQIDNQFSVQLDDILDSSGNSVVWTDSTKTTKTAFGEKVTFGKQATAQGDKHFGAELLVYQKGTGEFISIGGDAPTTDATTGLVTVNNKSDTALLKIDLPNFKPVADGANTAPGMLVDFSGTFNYDKNGVATLAAVAGEEDGSNSGYRQGSLSGITIQNNGLIYGTYDNGQRKILGQIAVATFSNASGLEKKGDNLYSSTMNSGEFDGIGVDISTTGGRMDAGVLEMSNVDLSSEFTEMITTQRGFQANSRIITVSDTLLEELTNLKR